jgi:uncharacterized membrane protein YfcA
MFTGLDAQNREGFRKESMTYAAADGFFARYLRKAGLGEKETTTPRFFQARLLLRLFSTVYEMCYDFLSTIIRQEKNEVPMTNRGALETVVWFIAAALVLTAACVFFDVPAGAAERMEISSSEGMPERIREAINEGLADPAHGTRTRERIPPDANTGVFGIPGAPAPSYALGFLWAIWVGWIFSTVGAFGGIMAGVGHITIFGLGDYAKSFGKGHPLNTLLTDSIRVSNQWLGGTSAAISSFNYYRMKRLVLPIGLSLAVGSVAGSFLVPRLTAGQVNLKDYIGYFGLIVLLLGGYLFYQTTPRGRAKQKAAKAAADAFEAAQKERHTKDAEKTGGVEVVEGSMGLMFVALGLVLAGVLFGNLFDTLFAGASYLSYALVLAGLLLMFLLPHKRIRFTFFGVSFSFKAYVPTVGGFFIAAIASFLGVGGGFLLVPFLTSVAGLPMFLVAGTSALAVLVGMVISIFTYMVGQGVVVPWGMIGVELAGIFVGSMIGPRTQKYIPDVWLKRLFILLAFYVGIRYCTKGFLGYSILPPH